MAKQTVYNAIPEQDAKKKWCRHASMVVHTQGEPSAVAVNRIGSHAQPACRCLGTDCMAWETVEKEVCGGKTINIGFCVAEPGRD